MKRNQAHLTAWTGIIFAVLFLSCAVQAQASMKEIKAYKEAFPGAKVKCATCHSVAVPKKDAAGLNDYGKAAIAANPSPTVDTYKKLGKAETFKK